MPDLMTEFDDLIRALEEERPEIDPGFARELDNRAAAGFAKPRRRWRVAWTWTGAPAVAIGGIAALFIVVAIATGGGDSGAGTSSSSSAGGSSSAAGGSSFSAQPQVAQDEASSASSGAVSSAPRQGVAAKDAGGRVQERSAALTLVAPAKDVPDVGDRIIATADQVGGFVESSTVRATDGSDGGGEFALRVPVGRLDDALSRLSRLAHVSERSQGSQDITGARNRARGLLQEALAERRSLLNQLAAATTTAEIDAIKAKLRFVGSRIDAYTASLAHVNRRARFAAVSVTLTTNAQNGIVAGDDGKWTPADALRDAGRVLEVAAGVLVVAASILIPLVLLALLAGLALRVSGRRGRNRMLDAV